MSDRVSFVGQEEDVGTRLGERIMKEARAQQAELDSEERGPLVQHAATAIQVS